MPTNKGNTTIIILIIFGFLFLPALFKKSTTTKETLNNDGAEEETLQAKATENGTEAGAKETAKSSEAVSATKKVPEEKSAETSGTETKEAEKLPVDPNISIYSDKITIRYISGSSEIAKEERIVLRNESEESINVTGFSIETYSLRKFIIPKAYNLPGFAVFPTDDIILAPDGEVTIYVGTQERKMDFRENICTGYFDENSNFGGALSHRCPIIDTSKMLNFSDACGEELDNIQRCKVYHPATIVDQECNQFGIDHYSYVGCVKDYKNTKDFYSNSWIVWMQRSTEFFKRERELVIIKDKNGKLVDQYQY